MLSLAYQTDCAKRQEALLRDPMRCSLTLDRRMLEFFSLVMATGWLCRGDNAGRSGRCIRSRCGVGLRCSVYANPPVFLARLQGS